ncbi:MAG: hypothetical protein K2H92_00490, partial [Bacteroidaceae bacterium]|nr:hypothetical protein [Bacteroidaceae bacterium]
SSSDWADKIFSNLIQPTGAVILYIMCNWSFTRHLLSSQGTLANWEKGFFLLRYVGFFVPLSPNSKAKVNDNSF